MNLKVYLRVWQTERGLKVDASEKVNIEPVYQYPKRGGKAYPTVSFSLLLDIPEEKFKEAESIIQQINLKLSELKINTKAGGIKDE